MTGFIVGVGVFSLWLVARGVGVVTGLGLEPCPSVCQLNLWLQLPGRALQTFPLDS